MSKGIDLHKTYEDIADLLESTTSALSISMKASAYTVHGQEEALSGWLVALDSFLSAAQDASAAYAAARDKYIHSLTVFLEPEFVVSDNTTRHRQNSQENEQ